MPFLTDSERVEVRSYLSDEGIKAFEEILKSYKVDLGTNTQGYFSQDDQRKIWRKAGELLKERLEAGANNGDRSAVHLAWQKIVEDFYLNKYWGYHFHSGVAPKIDWEEADLEQFEIEKKRTRAIEKEAKPYIIRFFIGLVIWKMVILYLAQNGFFDWWGDR